MHLFDPAVGFMGGHGIVGGQIPIGAGLGWAIRYRGDDQVCVCFMGDAAVNQGVFLESLNMSAIWHLPVIYVVENNEYGMGTAFSRVSATEMEARSGAYGIPAPHRERPGRAGDLPLLRRDGRAPCAAARAPSSSTPRPTGSGAIQCRIRSRAPTRSKEEVESHVQEQDPITILRDRLMAAEMLTQAELEAMDAEARAVCEDAAEFADASPLPDPSTLYDHVYAEINEHGRLFLDGRGPGPGGSGWRRAGGRARSRGGRTRRRHPWLS